MAKKEAGGQRELDGQENIVLCGANSYEQKYYFNRAFDRLPEEVKRELQIMCVLFTEDVGGVLTLEFTSEGELDFKVQVDEGDYLFDEIGSGLKIRQYQREKRELLRGLEVFYQVFFLGLDSVLGEETQEAEREAHEAGAEVHAAGGGVYEAGAEVYAVGAESAAIQEAELKARQVQRLQPGEGRGGVQ